MTPSEVITVIIPTSPIALNPSTEIMDETYAQMRKHLPEAKLIILADGVHPEEEYLRKRYEGYLENLSLRAFEWKDTTIVSYGAWKHQSGMLKDLLFGYEDNYFQDTVKTPLVFWSEHDIPLRDGPIDWQGIVDTLLEGEIGGIRFELTGDPPKRDEVQGAIVTHGIPLVLSTQYVNWPQVFRLDYFKDFVKEFGDSKTYLECAELDNIVRRFWNHRKYGIYSPEGEIRRCYHTNGRCRGFGDPGKPYIEVAGHRRNIYNTPYKPLF